MISEDTIRISTPGYEGFEDYQEPWDFEMNMGEPEGWEYEELQERFVDLYAMANSDFVENAVSFPDPASRELVPFSFTDRPYLKRIYYTPSPRILLVAGRQVEKCVWEEQTVLMNDGRLVPIKRIQVGDEVACMSGDSFSAAATGTVSWRSARLQKTCIQITTASGNKAVVASTHPIWTPSGWVEAGDLTLTSSVAVTVKAGEYTGEELISDARLYNVSMCARSGCSLPEWGPKLDEAQTGTFLKGVMSGEEYTSRKREDVEQVQALLWKKGAVTTIRNGSFQSYRLSSRALSSEEVGSDTVWETIASLEVLGNLPCYDITVDDHHNFIVGGIVSHNSTTLAIKMLTMSCMTPHFKTLFVSPSNTQTKDFSKNRIREVLETCPTVRAWFPSHLTDNVYEKQAINRSLITLRYAFLNADRCRGQSADEIVIDEFQDILLDNVPVIEEAASHSHYKRFLYAGTPKSLDNAIQYYYDAYSTKNERAVPCDRHGTPKNPGSWHWNLLDETNVGVDSLVCDKCSEQIFPNHPDATWVQTGRPPDGTKQFEGFRIPQIMVPWIDWADIRTKQKHYPRSKFFNEVLGLSYDSGQRPLRRQDIIDNCDDELSLQKFIRDNKEKLLGTRIYAGIDWGQDSTSSYTLISLGAYIDGFFKIFWLHRFEGAESEPQVQLHKIKRIIQGFKIFRVGTDYGGGFWPNDELLRAFGARRVVRYQYSTPRTFVHFDPRLGRFLLHRSEVMSAVFNAMKRRTVFRFPRWPDFQTPFAADMLNIFSEYDEKSRMTRYKKTPKTTDDTFHSILFCFMASLIDFPRPDILIPSSTIDREIMRASS